MVLKIGTPAPDFTAETDSGEKLSLSELKGKRVVLYFYPKDETPGCTKEACSFRDNWSKFGELGAVVLGVSSDSTESHRKFKQHHSLPFTLLSDPDKSVRQLYDVKGSLMPPRVTYVIDEHGIIRHVYNSQLNAEKHISEALEALKSLSPQEAQKTGM
ncbi:MAG: peroxiredoxin [Thermoprotei archaeon]